MRSQAISVTNSGTFTERLEVLSPVKRALLEKRLGRALPGGNPFQITRRAPGSTAPLSFSQEGLLFMEQLEPETSRYNVYEAIRLNGRLDRTILQQTLDDIVARHEALRTVFENAGDGWQQVIQPASAASVKHLDLRTSCEGVDAIDLLQKEADTPVDIYRGPIFSALLVTADDDESYLLIKMHHILSDGWSLGIYWKEFAEIYSARSQNRPAALGALPIQFGDYAAWSRQYLQREIDRQTEYWKKQIDGSPALLELPTDRPRPALQTAKGAQESVTFPRELLDRVNELCKREGCTLYMALLAGFDACLARYTDTEDLVVGTPIAGRSRTEIENLVGYFVNTLPLRTDMSGDPTFRDLLGRVRGAVLDAFSHQDVPFEHVVAAVKPERSLSYNPIYQVAFALQERRRSAVSLPGLDVTPVELQLSTSKFDLFLSAQEASDGLNITVEYSTDLFDRETIQRFIAHYQNLLASATNAPELRLSQMELLSQEERRQLLTEWNQTRTGYPKEAIHHIFAAQCEAYPVQIAVAASDEMWTYREMNEWSNRIANHLVNLGVGAGQRIGICMDRSPLMIAAILGVLKCGAAYVPMDTANPAFRLQQMVADAELTIILTCTEHIALVSQTPVTAIDVDAEKDAVDSCSSVFISKDRASDDDTACILYTSGSTGRPKGVMIPHRAISRLVRNTNYIEINRDDRFAHVANVAFDLAIFDIWGALLNGARTVIIPKDIVLLPERFSAEVKASGVTTICLATSLFHLIAREKPDAFSSVQTLIVAGEAFDPAAARQILASNPPQRLLNGYGPTESTTFATWKLIDEAAANEPSLSIGQPVSNTTIFILDDDLNLVPIGVAGEVFIGGDGLATGYLNRPELNEERFVSIPFQKFPDDAEAAESIRLYRTGDLARYRANGEIDYIGRKDNQVKLRGFRIELGEIEAIIEAHRGVAEAVVLAIKDSNDHRLAAYYVASSGAKISPDELRSYLRENLPHYMVPVSLNELAAMPLNGNGKIDRQRLASQVIVSQPVHDQTEKPKNELQIKLTWIWQKVLGLSSIGIQDNFFDLGGHSLAAVRVFSEIESALGCRLPLATLFKAPTIEQLSELIEGSDWRSSWASIVPMRTGGSKPPFFCIHAVGGNILEYNDLARNLGPDQPFYGLQSIGLDGRSAPLTDLGAMADAYVKEIRKIQPVGPYYLGGRSFGGTVAYEMARRLYAEGQEVALLAIFDSYPKGWLKRFSQDEAHAYRRQFLKMRAQRHLQLWIGLSLADKFRYGWTKLGYKSRKLRNIVWQVSHAIRPATESVSSTVRNIEEINYLAIKSYVPEIYDGKVTFFSAGEEVCPEENLTGWRVLATGGVDVVGVPGDHQTMIKEPHVGDLARLLEDAIGRTSGIKSPETGGEK